MYNKPHLFGSIAVISLLLVTVASAQSPSANPAPGAPGGMMGTRVEGKVKSLSGDQLTVTTSDGKTLSVTLADNAMIGDIQTVKFEEIQVGDFVGSGAKLGADGKLHAQEVHLMAGASRGMGEGHRQMGNDPAQSMTNATVVRIEKGAKSNTMVLKYPGGEQAIEVDAGTPITKMGAADRKRLTPGAAVMVMATPDQTGKLTASNVMLGAMPRMAN